MTNGGTKGAHLCQCGHVRDQHAHGGCTVKDCPCPGFKRSHAGVKADPKRVKRSQSGHRPGRSGPGRHG